jgi:hypothetical protein
MTSRAVIALCALLCLSGASLAAEPSQPEGDTVKDAGTASEATESSPAEPEEPGTDRTPSDAETEGNASPPLNVYRHRPGACPEGPPCKEDE